jgi:hypothetical protein
MRMLPRPDSGQGGEHLVELHGRLANNQLDRLSHLAQVVRRDLGRHADGNARGAVQKHKGQACRQ